MNKQELIYKIEKLPYNLGPIVDTMKINRAGLIKLIEQLDEPQKVAVPQFVADWLNENDWREETLGKQSVFDVLGNLKNDSKNGYYENVKRWIDENGDLFARAWLDGYTIEEKRYRVKIIGIKDYYSYLNYRKEEKGWTVESKMEVDKIRTSHTRKELEQAGFGWVFDCPGIEIEEVE